MKIKSFEGLSKEEIIDNLESMCVEVEQKQFLNPFTDSEFEEAKSDYTEHCKDVAILDDKINNLISPLKEEKKAFVKLAKNIMDEIKVGGRMETGKVYLIADFDNRSIIEYSEEGVMVGSRPFTHKERQLHINSHKSLTITKHG